ncbi:MAG: hypothetical protein AABY22_29840 [Nanoarchaeota archaeon]
MQDDEYTKNLELYWDIPIFPSMILFMFIVHYGFILFTLYTNNLFTEPIVASLVIYFILFLIYIIAVLNRSKFIYRRNYERS